MEEYRTYDSVIQKIEELRQERNTKAKQQFRFTYTVVLIMVVLVAMILLLIGLPWFVPLIVVGAVLFLMVLIYGIASATRENTLKNEYLNEEIIGLYNSIHDRNYRYDYKAVMDKYFNKDMGLFTSYASVRSKFLIASNKETGLNYQILGCQLITSDGKNTSIHFDGFYTRIPMYNIERQQFRSRGKAHAKGIKMVRLEDYEDRIYVPDDNSVVTPDPILYGIFKNIPNALNVRHYYVASNNKEVVIAIELRDKFKLPKELTYASLQEYSEPLFELIQFIDECVTQIEDMANFNT